MSREMCRRFGCVLPADWFVLLTRDDRGQQLLICSCNFHLEGMRRLANELYLFAAFDKINLDRIENLELVLPQLPT